MIEKPIYALRELIKSKYGPKRSYLFGCGMVAQWLRINSKSHYDAYRIRQFAALHSERNVSLTIADKEALRQLFNLRSIDALYTTVQECDARNDNQSPEADTTIFECTHNFVI